MNNSGNIIKLIVLGIIAVGLITLIIILLNNGFNFSFKKAKLLYDESYTEEINKINIDVTSSDIIIEPTDSDKLNVKIYDHEDKDIEIKVKDKTLEIVNKQKNMNFFSIFTGQPKVEISVPKNSIYDLNINGKSSDVKVSSNVGIATVDVTSGDVSFEDAEKLEIKVTSGDVNVGKTSTLKIKTTSGDIRVDKVTKKADLQTTSGDIKVDELSLKENSEIQATSGDITVDKINDIYVEGKTKSGDININKNNRHSDIELKLETTSGDIRVE